MLTRFFRRPTTSSLRFLSQNLHIEEEYFEDFDDPKSQEFRKKEPVGFRREGSEEQDFVGSVVGALTEQKARDVFVVRSEEKEMTPFSHKIICSVFNSRQAAAISENLRSKLKIDGLSNGMMMSHVKKTTKRSNGWYVSEVDQIQIHVMSEECREKYELEAIWAGDDRILDEIDEEKMKILLPPKRVSK
ncbi:hypothetical protein CAEBREN_12914 [Caenorhabditis brenneri]|uniref:Uncharacterized protein n=1 Tax=Caenorhabditis brenneri TaxID=135651 RepID=G0N093_CAEBE|nr:hypothetical protein CAEBREN_12914 [Caenorhabditis brenneri]